MRYELTDFEWTAIRSLPPNKPRGIASVDELRVLNGIFSSAVALTRRGCQELYDGDRSGNQDP
jgi:transposase